MLDSQTDIHCGAVLAQYQATNVYPGYREVSLGVATQVFGGTCGTISWQVWVEECKRLKFNNLDLLKTSKTFIWNTLPPQKEKIWKRKAIVLKIYVVSLFQIVELSLRLIVMWSVPFNLNLYDTYLGLAMIYNQVWNKANTSAKTWFF